MSWHTGRNSLKDTDSNATNPPVLLFCYFYPILLYSEARGWRQAEHQCVRPEMRWQAGCGHKLKSGQFLGSVQAQETLMPEQHMGLCWDTHTYPIRRTFIRLEKRKKK